MVAVGLLDEQQLAGARREPLHPVRAVANDARVAVPIGVVDDELPACGVVGGEREPEKALLPARSDLRAEIEKRLCEDLAVLDDADQAALLDHVEQARGAGGGCDMDRRLQPTDDRDEP